MSKITLYTHGKYQCQKLPCWKITIWYVKIEILPYIWQNLPYIAFIVYYGQRVHEQGCGARTGRTAVAAAATATTVAAAAAAGSRHDDDGGGGSSSRHAGWLQPQQEHGGSGEAGGRAGRHEPGAEREEGKAGVRKRGGRGWDGRDANKRPTRTRGRHEGGRAQWHEPGRARGRWTWTRGRAGGRGGLACTRVAEQPGKSPPSALVSPSHSIPRETPATSIDVCAAFARL